MTSETVDWEGRYASGNTSWDLGAVSPPLKAYIDQLRDKELRILIPGGGNSYEAEYLFRNGFTRVDVVDIVRLPLANLKRRAPNFPDTQLHARDFFEMNGVYDVILEQTFLCALSPERRPQYAKKIHSLLKPGGKLVGVLFDFPLEDDGPPFGGDEASYRALFGPHFTIKTMERCHNSAPSRAGRELFVRLERSNITR